MITAVLQKLGSLKLTLSQYLLVVGAGVIAVLASVLKFKQHELVATRVALLKSHSDNQQKIRDDVANAAVAKAKASTDKYEAALNRLNSLRAAKR